MRTQSAGVWFELSVWLVLAITAYALTFEFADEAGSYAWGAASWPRAIIFLLVLSAVVHAFMRRKALVAADDSDSVINNPVVDAERPLTLSGSIRLIGLFAIPLVYVYLLPRAGFYLTTPFFLLCYLFYLGERRWHMLLIVPLLIYLIINLAFTRLFYVALPTGIWPGFYDFSNWFLSVVR